MSKLIECHRTVFFEIVNADGEHGGTFNHSHYDAGRKYTTYVKDGEVIAQVIQAPMQLGTSYYIREVV